MVLMLQPLSWAGRALALAAVLQHMMVLESEESSTTRTVAVVGAPRKRHVELGHTAKT